LHSGHYASKSSNLADTGGGEEAGRGDAKAQAQAEALVAVLQMLICFTEYECLLSENSS
jgi:hypothetical protein